MLQQNKLSNISKCSSGSLYRRMSKKPVFHIRFHFCRCDIYLFNTIKYWLNIYCEENYSKFVFVLCNYFVQIMGDAADVLNDSTLRCYACRRPNVIDFIGEDIKMSNGVTCDRNCRISFVHFHCYIAGADGYVLIDVFFGNLI